MLINVDISKTIGFYVFDYVCIIIVFVCTLGVLIFTKITFFILEDILLSVLIVCPVVSAFVNVISRERRESEREIEIDRLLVKSLVSCCPSSSARFTMATAFCNQPSAISPPPKVFAFWYYLSIESAKTQFGSLLIWPRAKYVFGLPLLGNV